MPRKTTRNAQGSGTIRQRPDGRWEARVTIGHDPGTGRQIQKSLYGKTQKEVRQRLNQVTAEVDAGTYAEPSKLCVSEWLEAWLTDYCTNTKPRTVDTYKSTVTMRINPHIGNVKLSKLNTMQIQRMYNDLLRGTDDGHPPLSAKTVRDTHGVLHRALQQALELGIIRTNPSDLCKLPHAETPEIKALDTQQIAALLQRIKGHPYENLYIVDLFTGMRLGEILGLSWDCIDFDSGVIRIYRQLHQRNGVYTFGPLKNGKARSITVAPSVLAVLKRQRAKQREWQLASGGLWKNADNLVFTNEAGGHLARNTPYNALKRITREMGLPDVRFHDLRHSYAVASLQAGDDIKTLQTNLGHHTAAFTLSVYGHCTDEMQRASAQRMEGFIKGISEL